MDGIRLRPIRLRKSLYLLIPMELARLIGVTKESRFLLTLRHDGDYVLEYERLEDPGAEEEKKTQDRGS